MCEYRIVPAVSEHIPFLAAIEQAAASLFPSGAIPEAIREDSVPLPILEEALLSGTLLIALAGNGMAVGFGLLREEEGYAVLAQLDVMPEHGRRGIGKKLVQGLLGRARALGYEVVYLTTFDHIPWNRPFYERLGFRILDEGTMPHFLIQTLSAERARGMVRRVAMRKDV